MNKTMQKGFTLIELMIVVAIIGILAAVAVPQYQNYVTKSKWSDNLTTVEPLKLAISECLQNQGAVIASCDSIGELKNTVGYGNGTSLPTGNSAYLASVTIDGSAGIVILGTVAVGTGGNACTVTVTPTVGNSAVSWAYVNSGTGCSKVQTGVGS